MSDKPAQVYVSHSHKDMDWVLPFVEGLRSLGISVFSDVDLVPGRVWADDLSKNLRNAEVMIAVVSRSYVESAHGRAEVLAAASYLHERDRGLIIPILIHGVGVSDLPAELQRYQVLVDSRNDPEGIALKVAEALATMRGTRAAVVEKKVAVAARVVSESAKFVADSKADLRAAAGRYRSLAQVYFGVGAISLFLAIALAVIRMVEFRDATPDWPALVELLAMGVVAITLLVALAKYSYTIGRAYMSEALKYDDRAHAIAFGEFYLRAFESEAEWDEVKEAFQNWNLDRRAEFGTSNPAEFDPKLVESIQGLVEAVGRLTNRKPAE